MDKLVFMGDDDDGDVDLVDGLKQLHDVHRHFGVDVAGGLVRDDELGAVGQRAGNGHTLLLAAGELIRQAVHFVLQTDKGECKRYAVLDLFGRDVRHAHGEGDILIDGHGGDQAEILEHNAHLAAQVGHLAALDAR